MLFYLAMKIQKTQRVVLVQSGSHHHLIENYGIKQQVFKLLNKEKGYLVSIWIPPMLYISEF